MTESYRIEPDATTTDEGDIVKESAAREAILDGISIFPDLERDLFKVLGPTAESVMLHQLCYWFGKSKMRGRRWLYKTTAEWREERGLNRKQSDKGRARLESRGVIECKTGQYKRTYYRVNWIQLADMLGVKLPEEDVYEEDNDFPVTPPDEEPDGSGNSEIARDNSESSICTPLKGHSLNLYPLKGEHVNLYPPRGAQSNSGDYSGKLLHKNSSAEGSNGSSSLVSPTREGEEITTEKLVATSIRTREETGCSVEDGEREHWGYQFKHLLSEGVSGDRLLHAAVQLGQDEAISAKAGLLSYFEWEKLRELIYDQGTRAGRLARAFSEGKKGPNGPITTNDVARAAVEELEQEGVYGVTPSSISTGVERIVRSWRAA